MVNVIGEMAGKVWNELNKNGNTTLAKLKTNLKADAFILNASIGWLAREEKIVFTKKGSSITIGLK